MTNVCEVFVDSGRTRPRDGAVHITERVCATCGWIESAHTDEVRAIQRGEHPDAVLVRWGDETEAFVRRRKWRTT